MKNISKTVLVILVGLALLGISVTASAQVSKGNGLDRKGLRSNPSAKVMIERGTLRQGAHGQWLLDNVYLVFNENSRVSRKGSEMGYAALDDGAQAFVLGTLRSGSLVVTRVLMLDSSDVTSRGNSSRASGEEQIQPAPVDAPR